MGHTLAKTEAEAATCTEAGNIDYWTCGTCKKLFSDAEGTTEIEEKDTVVAAKGHTLTKTEAEAATCTEAGNIEYWTCSECGKIFSDEKGETEISQEETVVAAEGHNLTKTEAKDASQGSQLVRLDSDKEGDLHGKRKSGKDLLCLQRRRDRSH